MHEPRESACDAVVIVIITYRKIGIVVSVTQSVCCHYYRPNPDSWDATMYPNCCHRRLSRPLPSFSTIHLRCNTRNLVPLFAVSTAAIATETAAAAAAAVAVASAVAADDGRAQ